MITPKSRTLVISLWGEGGNKAHTGDFNYSYNVFFFRWGDGYLGILCIFVFAVLYAENISVFKTLYLKDKRKKISREWNKVRDRDIGENTVEHNIREIKRGVLNRTQCSQCCKELWRIDLTIRSFWSSKAVSTDHWRWNQIGRGCQENRKWCGNNECWWKLEVQQQRQWNRTCNCKNIMVKVS